MEKESTTEFVDRVKKVEPVNGGYRIFFQKQAGIYYLKNDSSSFVELEKAILSFAMGEKIHVTALSDCLQIASLKRL